MSLTVALKFKNGSILATDTRVMYGDSIKIDQKGKLKILTEYSGVGSAGLSGATDDILRSVQDFCDSHPASFDDVCSCLSDKSLQWFEKNAEKIDEEDDFYGFLIVSQERIRKIDQKGYGEEYHDYACDGSGLNYGYYILQNHYKKDLDENEAKELVAYTILETSKMDPSVSEDIQMAVFSKEKKHVFIEKDEIQDIKTRLAPISMDSIKSRNKTIESITNRRDEINNLWKKNFGFKLFHQNERAVFLTTLPCRSESEFTTNISALALLIDRLNIEEMKKIVTTDEKGSITILNEFLNEKIKEHPVEIISNFRDIITLRSKKTPIHETDVKFVNVVIKIVGKYPADFPELYSKALDMYEESLKKLLECLQNFQHTDET